MKYIPICPILWNMYQSIRFYKTCTYPSYSMNHIFIYPILLTCTNLSYSMKQVTNNYLSYSMKNLPILVSILFYESMYLSILCYETCTYLSYSMKHVPIYPILWNMYPSILFYKTIHFYPILWNMYVPIYPILWKCTYLSYSLKHVPISLILWKKYLSILLFFLNIFAI